MKIFGNKNKMKKIMNKLGEIKHDKLLHFFYGTIISFIGVSIFGLPGLWLTVVIGAWKELVYDWWLGHGKPDIWDFVWTMLPVIMFVILYLIRYFLLNNL